MFFPYSEVCVRVHGGKAIITYYALNFVQVYLLFFFGGGGGIIWVGPLDTILPTSEP